MLPAIVGLGISAIQAASSASAANRNLKAQYSQIGNQMDLIGKQSDLAGNMITGVRSQVALEKNIAAASVAAARTSSMARRAESQSAIADVNSMNRKAEQIDMQGKIAATQGKADSLMRLRNYNDVAAAQMVQGVASGRVTEGSVSAIMQGDYEMYQWDKLWNEHSQVIEQAAYESDEAEMYVAGANTLMNAQAKTMVGRMTSMNDMRNSYLQAQSRAIGRESQMTDISSRMLGLESQTLGLFSTTLGMKQQATEIGNSFSDMVGNAVGSYAKNYGAN